jgi:hypothetical protein
MNDSQETGGQAPPKKKRLGVGGYIRAMWLARTAAVTWPEAKEMARRNEPDPSGPVDIVKDSERPADRENRP